MADRLKRQDDRNEPGPAARALMVASTLVVAALFAYVVYQAVTAPAGGEPQAQVVSNETTAEGDLRVEVAVTNKAERGLRQLVVEVPCEEPAPQATLTNIPAQGQRRAILLCPAESSNVTASIVSYTWT